MIFKFFSTKLLTWWYWHQSKMSTMSSRLRWDERRKPWVNNEQDTNICPQQLNCEGYKTLYICSKDVNFNIFFDKQCEWYAFWADIYRQSLTSTFGLRNQENQLQSFSPYLKVGLTSDWQRSFLSFILFIIDLVKQTTSKNVEFTRQIIKVLAEILKICSLAKMKKMYMCIFS